MTAPVQIYPQFRLARFIDRPNRFIMHLRDEQSGQMLVAHVPNTGRMTEFLIPGRPFALLPTPENRTQYRVIATCYQNEWVFLDTIRCNRIVEYLIKNNHLSGLGPIDTIQREASYGSSRFDFRLTDPSGLETWLEVKSVTLCHNGVALFPDAPTERGLKHLTLLEQMKRAHPSRRIVTLYLVLNGSARTFSINPHTHPEYAQNFLKQDDRHALSYKLPFIDPISFEPDSLTPLPIQKNVLRELSRDVGAYLILLRLTHAVECRVGALGKRHFPAGFYLYVGSAHNSLSKRIKRHLKVSSNKRWHLDYLRPYAQSVNSYPIRSTQKDLEQQLVCGLLQSPLHPVPGFGCSDSPHPSHLFLSPEHPFRTPQVTALLFDAYTEPFSSSLPFSSSSESTI